MTSTSPETNGLSGPTAVRVMLRPLANPLPLGFLALAGGTLVVSGLQLGWVVPDEGRNVAVILVAFVVPLQLVASVLGFLARDVVAGTGMGVLSGTWLAVGLVTYRSAPDPTSDALGLLLIVSAVAMLVPALGAAESKQVPAGVLTGAALRFGVTGVYQLSDRGWAKQLAGWVGVALFGIAVYAALAMLLEDARRRTVLPLGRSGPGERAVSGGLAAQLSTIEHEAGVRQQL